MVSIEHDFLLKHSFVFFQQRLNFLAAWLLSTGLYCIGRLILADSSRGGLGGGKRVY